MKEEDIEKQFSEERKQKLIKKFISLYGNDSMMKEKANSFAVGFSKAWEIIIEELKKEK